MKPKKVNVETIHQFIEEVKKIKAYPSNICFLTYCKLEDRLYFRLEGPQVEDQPYINYYCVIGGHEGYSISPEKFANVVRKYLERHDLNVFKRKIPYHMKIEHKKRLSEPEIKSIIEILTEMPEENNHG